MNISYSARLCLALSEIRGFGLKAFHTLRQYSPDIAHWPKLTQCELRGLLNNASLAECVSVLLRQETITLPERVETWLENSNCALVSYFDQAYPGLLREVHLAPALLYAQGDVGLLNTDCLAVVGSRKTSPMYKRFAEQFGFELARHNWTVVSGLALGIDTAAHMGALAAAGKTIAVVATGLDRCYPARNRDLQDRIIEQGLLVSEMPLGSAPLKQHFPRRNRIVSGLSQGVLVVEAGIKSGSLITARYALEQNRDVYALPGSPANIGSEGCNYLIRDGAYLVSSAQELLADLHLSRAAIAPVNADGNDRAVSNTQEHSEVDFSKEEWTLLELLADQVLCFDELYAASELSFEGMAELLLKLEIDGVIAQVAGGYQRVS